MYDEAYYEAKAEWDARQWAEMTAAWEAEAPADYAEMERDAEADAEDRLRKSA